MGPGCQRLSVALVYFRDDLKKWSFGHNHLTSDEAGRIAKAIARLPQFLMQRRGFYQRGGGDPRWKPSRPYHVALEDGYIRAPAFEHPKRGLRAQRSARFHHLAGGARLLTANSYFFVQRTRSAKSFSSISMRPSYSAKFRSLCAFRKIWMSAFSVPRV